jgi:hypothetical protein
MTSPSRIVAAFSWWVLGNTELEVRETPNSTRAPPLNVRYGSVSVIQGDCERMAGISICRPKAAGQQTAKLLPSPTINRHQQVC